MDAQIDVGADDNDAVLIRHERFEFRSPSDLRDVANDLRSLALTTLPNCDRETLRTAADGLEAAVSALWYNVEAMAALTKQREVAAALRGQARQVNQ